MDSKVVFATLPLIIAIIYYYVGSKSNQEPPISPPHPHRTLDDFLSLEDHKDLMSLLEEIKDFPAAAADFTSTSFWNDIGEALDPIITKDETNNKTIYKCPDSYKYPYLVFNDQINKCVFANRLDIARHFLLTGGYDGWKEKYTVAASRLLLFNNFQFETASRPEFVKLFNDAEFRQAVSDICGQDRPYFRPYQLSLIMQMPGQNVPAHLDIPYFLGASRYLVPQWLLLVMQDSGLFKDRRIPQVQALVYLHDWDDTQNDTYLSKHGEFVLWPQGVNYDAFPITPKPRSAIFCDGSEAVHATATYQPTIPPILMDKDADKHLIWDENVGAFRLHVNNVAREETYNWKEIRSSVAYRGWCFKTEKEMNEYDPRKLGDLTLDDILNTLKKDLIERKRITQYKLDQLTPYEFGLLLLDEYIQLPLPQNVIIPYNYCMAFKLLPEWVFNNPITRNIAIFTENLICSGI